MLPVALIGPNYLSGGTANALGWARCVCSFCRQWHRLGSIIFRQVLPMPWEGPIALVADASRGFIRPIMFLGGAAPPMRLNGPIALAALAANGVAWAQLLFGMGC
jgi:hypothetical protein